MFVGNFEFCGKTAWLFSSVFFFCGRSKDCKIEGNGIHCCTYNYLKYVPKTTAICVCFVQTLPTKRALQVNSLKAFPIAVSQAYLKYTHFQFQHVASHISNGMLMNNRILEFVKDQPSLLIALTFSFGVIINFHQFKISYLCHTMTQPI